MVVKLRLMLIGETRMIDEKKLKKLFMAKTVLITGGTGYLGRHITSEILKYEPHSIRLLSRDEVKHHNMQEQFGHNIKLRHFVGDVRDYERMEKAAKGADIVIHAAALKRLDMIEYNVEESVKTNVIGTLNVVRACLANNVEKAVFISTDKACSPVNTYGACKFLAERIFSESNRNKGACRTIFTVVRYGNVLESTGSVIPFFESRIKKGEPIMLTDRRMTRFIITPQQAVELIFKSLIYCKGGEVFVPKLDSFRITDLITILKRKHNSGMEVVICGLRPGEKINEWMLNDAEVRRTYSFQDMFVITSEINRVKGAEYAVHGKKLSEDSMDHYSSDQCLLSLDEATKLFKKLGLI